MFVRASHHYDHDLNDVYEAFSDSEFYLSKFSTVGARKVEILATESDEDSFMVETRRDVPSDVPAMLRSFLGEWNTLVQKEQWEGEPDDEYYNTFTIRAEGVPVTMDGTMTLSPDGDGCVNEVEIEIKCSVPLVGKKLAEFVARDAERNLVAEYEFIKTYLADGG